jgi:dienelactone hydrolase
MAAPWLQDRMARAIVLPAPDGRYAVGTREFTLADPARGRKIGLKAWYPAMEDDPERYETYLADEEMAQLHAGKGPNHFAYLARIKTHAQPEAEFVNDLADCPVVFFSHGHSLSNRTNSLVCESLASHGYVVCAIGYPGEGFCTLIDGKKIGMDPAIVEKMIAEARKIASDHPKLNIRDHPGEYIRLLITEGHTPTERIKVWTDDLRLAADWLETGTEPFYKGRLQTGKYAAFGHSFGGAAALRVMLFDDRFLCGVNMDGGQYGGDFIEHILRKPMMVMSHNAAGLRTGFHPEQRGVWWLSIPTATHLNFTDGSLVYGPLPRLLRMNGKIDGQRMIALMSTVLRTFFDQDLLLQKNDLRQVLDRFPEICVEYAEPEVFS